MEVCCFVFGGLGALIGGIIGIGWLILAPFGPIANSRVKKVRYRLSDLFWLLLLLQPSLALFAALVRSREMRIEGWAVAILILVWAGTALCWVVMTGALSNAGIENTLRRAIAQIVILPVIAVFVPIVILCNFGLVARAIEGFRYTSDLEFWGFIALNPVLIATVITCRLLVRWIAAGSSTPRLVPPSSNSVDVS